MVDLRGKRLLILGGSRISIEIVKKAKEKGIYTIVTDWYDMESSPAKEIADKAYQVSTTDMDGLLDLIKRENIEGILTGYTDSTLPYYAQICELSGLPCYGSKELFDVFTEKNSYKKLLSDFDVPVVDNYTFTKDEMLSTQVDVKYPVLVKPSDSSGGRGVSICRNHEELIKGYEKAEANSETNSVLVERFIEGEEVTLFFLFNNGEVHLSGIGNRHIKKNQGEDTIALPVAYTFPSYVIPSYVEKTYPKMKKMLESVNIQNGMMFAQCLIEDNECVVYDIGYRLTGSLEYKIQKEVCGYDPLAMMIDFAFTGDMFANTGIAIDAISPYWNAYGFNLTFLIDVEKEITDISGISNILNHHSVTDATLAHVEGEIVPISSKGTLKQICLRVFGKTESEFELKKSLQEIYELFDVKDSDGISMKLEGLDVDEINGKLVNLND